LYWSINSFYLNQIDGYREMNQPVKFIHQQPTPETLPKPPNVPSVPPSEQPIPIKDPAEKPNFDPVRDDPELIHLPLRLVTNLQTKQKLIRLVK
jgi:hypothetical protein